MHAISQAAAAQAPDRSRAEILSGMACLDTSGSRRLPILMEMVAALSRADDPNEVLRAFAEGFLKLDGPGGYVSLSTRGLAPGEYRITRLLTDDVAGAITASDPWREKPPVHRGGFFGEIIRQAYPEVIHSLNLRGDPVVGDALAKFGSMMAIPLFDDGEPLNWSISLREDPEGFSVKELEESNSIKTVPIPADEMPMYKRKGSEVADKLVGKLWTKEFLAKVRAIIKKTRAEKKNAKKK